MGIFANDSLNLKGVKVSGMVWITYDFVRQTGRKVDRQTNVETYNIDKYIL